MDTSCNDIRTKNAKRKMEDNMSKRNPTEGIERLLDINISFTPIPSKDFDDLVEGRDIDGEKINAAWVWDAIKMIGTIHPDFECLTVYVRELDRDENTCTIQLTTREDWMDRMNDDDADYTKELKEFLEKKYPDTKVEVQDTAYDHLCDPWDEDED
jgi:hypothetical protein